MNRIGVVICNYNKCDDVVNCIQSVLESKYTDFDLYVVDNASSDNSVHAIREKYADKLTLLVNQENLGGSGGFNTGVRKAIQDGHEYVYLLDNDVLVDENAMGELVSFLDQNPDTGMAGSRVYFMENPNLIQQAGQMVDFKEYCTEANYLGCTYQDQVPDVVYADAVAACSLLVRTSLIEQIGLMPEDNFLYWDDTEWGYKCNLAGYKVASIASSVVLHRMGAQKEAVNTFATYYAWRNWFDFFIRYTEEDQLKKMCTTLLHSLFSVIYGGMYRKEKNKVKTVMCAYDDAIHHVRGKAGANRIFDIDFNDTRLKEMLSGKHKVYLQPGRNANFADILADRLLALEPALKITVEPCSDYDLKLSMCTDIFSLTDMSLQNIYIDSDFNVFANEEDALYVINFNYSREAFTYANLPLFLEQAHQIRAMEKD